MGKYINKVFVHSKTYDLSADYAISAGRSTIASSYTFDEPVQFWDDFVVINIDHPYKYSNTTVTSLPASAVNYYYDDLFEFKPFMPIYNSSHSAITATSADVYVMSSYYRRANSHMCESIEGRLTQTATVIEHEQGSQWIVPVKFKVASYVHSREYMTLYDVEGPNATASDGRTFFLTSPRESDMHYYLNDYYIWGTTLPAVLFKDCGIADIPTYKSNELNYMLNTQSFSVLGNVGHVDSTSANEFVKFMNALQNLQDSDIVSATIKKSTYASSARYYQAYVATDSIRNYSILSARVDNTYTGCGTIDFTGLNVLQNAFYDTQGNHKAIKADDNTIYDEYTYYCYLSGSTYSTSAAATAAIQNLINARQYAEVDNVDNEYFFRGTLPSSAQVFSTNDCIMGNTFVNKRKLVSYNPDGSKLPCVPVRAGIYSTDDPVITAVKAVRLYRFRDLSTVITKPVIDTAHVIKNTDSTYTYRFDNLFVVNSAFNKYNTSSNTTIFKAAAFNTIQYSNPLVAPTEQCTATVAGYEALVSNYYNYCYSVYRNTYLPTSTASIDNATSLLPIAVGYDTTINTQLETLPTRNIYYCITLSK